MPVFCSVEYVEPELPPEELDELEELEELEEPEEPDEEDDVASSSPHAPTRITTDARTTKGRTAQSISKMVHRTRATPDFLARSARHAACSRVREREP